MRRTQPFIPMSATLPPQNAMPLNPMEEAMIDGYYYLAGVVARMRDQPTPNQKIRYWSYLGIHLHANPPLETDEQKVLAYERLKIEELLK